MKHVLFRHQAQLQIESELGKGSTFKIIISKARLAPPINSKDLLSGTAPGKHAGLGRMKVRQLPAKELISQCGLGIDGIRRSS